MDEEEDELAMSSGNYTPTILGHRPKCALLASARFAEFPKKERLNSLRPHLTRHNLFPSKRPRP